MVRAFINALSVEMRPDEKRRNFFASQSQDKGVKCGIKPNL